MLSDKKVTGATMVFFGSAGSGRCPIAQRERAAGLSTPTLIFASDNDANYVAPARVHASLVAGALPGATVVRMDEYGHFPFAEAPETFAAATTAFLHARIVSIGDMSPPTP